MAKSYGFTKESAKRVVDAVRRVEATPGYKPPTGSTDGIFNPRPLLKGILDETLAVGSTADVTIRVWNGTSEEDSGEVIEAADWYGEEVEAGALVVIAFISGRWYVIGVNCPA